MEIVIPDLYASTAQPLPFDRSLAIRAFLLRRDRGNLLVYSTEAVAGDPEVANLGGIARHYLNHRHEAAFGCDAIAYTLQAPLHCHANEHSSVSAKCKVAATFTERHMLDDDFEVIPTPRHTSGATAFLWHSGEHRCLFTADTIYLRDGKWVGALLAVSSDCDAYIKSLETLCGLEFDILVPWAAAGQPFHALVGKKDAQSHIDAIIDRLRGGQDH